MGAEFVLDPQWLVAMSNLWVAYPCIPLQCAFSAENKVFLGINLQTASSLPAATAGQPGKEAWCKAGLEVECCWVPSSHGSLGFQCARRRYWFPKGYCCSWDCGIASERLHVWRPVTGRYASKCGLKEFPANPFTLSPCQGPGRELCIVPTSLAQIAPEAVEGLRRSCSLPCFSCECVIVATETQNLGLGFWQNKSLSIHIWSHLKEGEGGTL